MEFGNIKAWGLRWNTELQALWNYLPQPHPVAPYFFMLQKVMFGCHHAPIRVASTRGTRVQGQKKEVIAFPAVIAQNPVSLRNGKTNNDTGSDFLLGFSWVSGMTGWKDSQVSKRKEFGLDGLTTHQKPFN